MHAARGRLRPPRPLACVLLTQLLACSPASISAPPSDAAPPTAAPPPAAPPSDASPPIDTSPPPAAPAPASPADPPPSATPAGPPPTAAPRECRDGERLDSGCTCRSGGACFDICCGPQAGCAHPSAPGGHSACILQANPPPPPGPAKPCTDGQSLADGCTCEGKKCMDICCVGSACSHHASEDGGWAKCIKR